MRIGTYTLVALVSVFSNVGAATIPASWTATSDTHAFGMLDGTEITAITPLTAAFQGVATGRFEPGEMGNWQADFGMPTAATAIVASDVNNGDFQEFAFSEPMEEGLFYIENFDSNSIARVVATGADSLDLLTGSTSISFTQISKSVGTLRTSNPEFNGEGDAVLEFTGNVTGLRIDFFGGDGNNGVFYSFAKEGVVALPEPTAETLVYMLALVPLSLRKGRQR